MAFASGCPAADAKRRESGVLTARNGSAFLPKCPKQNPVGATGGVELSPYVSVPSCLSLQPDECRKRAADANQRATLSGCCARATSSHAAAPPSNVMNSRRTPDRQDSTPGTADSCIHPHEMIATTPPIFFPKEVAQNRPPSSARGPAPFQKSFQAKFPGMAPKWIFDFRASSPPRGSLLTLARKHRHRRKR